MKVLRVIASMNPKWGGPSEGIRQVAYALSQRGYSTECLTLDDPAEDWIGSQPVKIHALGPTSLGTFRYSQSFSVWLASNHSRYDFFVISGLWQYHSLAAARVLSAVGREYFLMPHGMLDPWFNKTYRIKHIKKLAYWLAVERRTVNDAKRVLFTSQEERKQARLSFPLYSAKEAVVSYGTGMPKDADSTVVREISENLGIKPGNRVLLFLGRIHEKKGCDILIAAFARGLQLDSSIRLVMAGPDQSGLKETLVSQAAALGVADRVVWTGLVQGEAKSALLARADAFILPSHQENFGIAVAEALAVGLPVLISDRVNIWKEIMEDEAGFVEADTIEGTTRLIERWLSMSESQIQGFRSRARQCYRKRFSIEAMAESLIEQFSSIISKGADLSILEGDGRDSDR